MLSPKPWRVETVILLFAGILSCLCMGIVTVGVLRKLGVEGFTSANSFGSVVVATLSFQGVAWGLIYFFVRIHGLDWRDAFGLRNPDLLKSLIIAILVLGLALPVVLFLQALSYQVLVHLGWQPTSERAVQLLADTHSLATKIYLGFFAVVIAPVAEEFIFRGVLFPFIKQRGWPKLAWIGVSLLFAAIHFNLPTFLPLFVLALAFTWIYDKTDCLLASITAHSLFNATNLVVLFLHNR